MAVNYEVLGVINAVDQGQSSLCWLATTATLLSWRRMTLLDMKATAKELGAEFEALYAHKAPLSASMIGTFKKRARLITEAGQSRPAKTWEDLLRKHGPVAVGIDADAPGNYMAHLVTLYAIKGDETLKGTRLKFIDPAGGKKLDLTFGEFGKLHGAADAVNAPFDVFYSS